MRVIILAMRKSLRELPSVDQVLSLESTLDLVELYDRDYIVSLVRRALKDLRLELVESGSGPDRNVQLERVREKVHAAVESGGRASLRRVINATGVILHTGLGRAPLAQEAREAVEKAVAGYCNLEFDLQRGERGERKSHVEALVCAASQSEAAAVVNNNAAAVLLMLNTLARGREVIVSRGELVEIGGSFRIPDIIAASGSHLREVGTTNRTHLRDYSEAICAETAMILKVHPSNYRVEGFSAQVGLKELADLCRKGGLPLACDLGGGVLSDLRQWDLPHEPVVRDTLALGVDLASFSGDKILGGPQAGIIAGREKFLEPIGRNPLIRALRCDKLILAALEASLRLYRLSPVALSRSHPVLRMLTAPLAALESRGQKLVRALPAAARAKLQPALEPSTARAGSGALPLEEMPSLAVILRPEFCSIEELSRRLRLGQLPVVGRIQRGRLILDMRTVGDDEVEWLAAALVRAVEEDV